MAGLPTIEHYPLPTGADLPTAIPRWSVDPDRAVLLVHDMQRYFLQPFPEPLRREVVGNVAALRRRADALGVPVAYTAQPGGMTPEQRGLLKDIWGPGMRTTEEDRQVVPELAPADGDWVFTKWRYSAFFNTELLARMRAAGRDQLVVCGVYAHVGVLATAVEAFSNDLETFLVADAVADFSGAEHRMAIDYAARRCAVVALADEVLR
ncbi:MULTISPECIES: isochorismatase family protein [Kitasatospora]|uniref:Putative isochorismatase n=1 Tax=Kitasatospora setae (strain ATCC 33774 / DSM 43861 / JCM 3304 / KCC A-0304 / NBRC 14216 / KM-6054) TaxID=452652 RepID=E4N0J3_KITSK|nr:MULTISPECIES: isochorismatase family protein [Kitasatospora]BAJ31677.1 putative isochorismatase [Kitasatospora setae KM-6054]